MTIDINSKIKSLAVPITSNSSNNSEAKMSKKSIQAKVITGVALAGLVGLASYGIYAVTKGKVKTKPIKTNEQLLKLQEEAKVLRNKIKNEYDTRLSQFRPYDALSLIEQEALNFASENGLRKTNAKYITSSKDWILIRDYSKNLGKDMDIKNSGAFHFYYPSLKKRDFLSNEIKNRLKELSGDADWKDLRKIRKALREELINSKNKDQKNMLKLQISEIDDILVAKVKSESENYKIVKGWDIDSASKVMKKRYNTVEELNNLMPDIPKDELANTIRRRLFNYNLPPNEPLNLDIFPQYKDYRMVNNYVKSIKAYMNELTDNANKTLEFKKTLAQEFRQSEDVQKLKELNRQIREMKK